MADLELIVAHPWRIASRHRSSTTREYIGAVDKIDQLRAGDGEFETEAEFYAFWRKFPFKTARAVELLLAKQLDKIGPRRRRLRIRFLWVAHGMLFAMASTRRAGKGVAISLFSGAGGLDLGAEAAGFDVRAAVERNRDATMTMEKNFPKLASPVIQKDILDTSTAEILRAAGLRKGQRPDLLLGGPPCTPFSKSGFWLEWKRSGLDPDASLLQEYTRVLREARPRAFVLENVYALTYNNRASRPACNGCSVRSTRRVTPITWTVLHAANFGVPQARPRLFIVGSPKGEPTPELPAPTHGGSWERRSTGNGERALRHLG